jgi:predicted amidophosphoribosyltransferase
MAIFPSISICRGLLRGAGELLAPPSCGFCGARPQEGRRAICATCGERLKQEFYPACARCAAALPSPTDRCGACMARRDFPLRGATAILRYAGAGRDLVLRLKRDSDGVLAQAAAEMWLLRTSQRADAAEWAAIDLVTCIPQRPRFPWEPRNAAPSQLARALGGLLEKPVALRLLRVRKWLRPQHRLSTRQRQRNVRRAFRVAAGEDIKGRSILVVDDVMTSGATLCSAAQTLLDAGAREVWGAVTARGEAFGATPYVDSQTSARLSSRRKPQP